MTMPLPHVAPRFDTPIVRPFWEALAQGELKLPACSRCGAWQWYPYEFVKCHADAHHEWKPVAKTGTVFTHTTVHRSLMPDGSQAVVPYVSALVELDGAPGVRLATVLVNLGERRPEIGMRVRLAPQTIGDFRVPAFEPAEEATP
jgi:uncharacterized OB-fold protein